MRLSRKRAKELGITVDPPTSKSGPTKAADKLTRQLREATARRLEDELFLAHGLPLPEREYPFGKPVGRLWRADYAWPGRKLLAERDGGTFGRGAACPACGRRRGGAHSSVKDLLRDQEKLNWAARLGYRVLRFRPEQFVSGDAMNFIRAVLEEGV